MVCQSALPPPPFSSSSLSSPSPTYLAGYPYPASVRARPDNVNVTNTSKRDLAAKEFWAKPVNLPTIFGIFGGPQLNVV